MLKLDSLKYKCFLGDWPRVLTTVDDDYPHGWDMDRPQTCPAGSTRKFFVRALHKECIATSIFIVGLI